MTSSNNNIFIIKNELLDAINKLLVLTNEAIKSSVSNINACLEFINILSKLHKLKK